MSRVLEHTFFPRFNDTDALGHINNASIVTWFEDARRPVFELFIPDLDPKKWNLILARLEVDYLAQGFYQRPVTVKTWVERIGNSSFNLVQEASQEGVIISRGRFFHVYYDYLQLKSIPIPPDTRTQLAALLLPG